VRTARSLRELVDALSGRIAWPDLRTVSPGPAQARGVPGTATADRACGQGRAGPLDLSEVRGQPMGRLAVEVAAAGGHHLLLSGPPGSGKTMLAERLPGVLPPLDEAQLLETYRIHSAAALPLPPAGERRPPFRAPHHGISAPALIGGGSSWMRPGEVSLATARVTECHSKSVSRWRLLRKLARVVLGRRVRYLPVDRARLLRRLVSRWCDAGLNVLLSNGAAQPCHLRGYYAEH
jgi:predicted ATPase with chaperone activity